MKRSLPSLVALTLTCSLVFAPAILHAKGKSGKPAAPKPQYAIISAVDATAKTVTISNVNTPNPASKQLKVNERTEIEVNGQKGTLTDLKVGMKISTTLGMDPTVAARLVATTLLHGGH